MVGAFYCSLKYLYFRKVYYYFSLCSWKNKFWLVLFENMNNDTNDFVFCINYTRQFFMYIVFCEFRNYLNFNFLFLCLLEYFHIIKQ